jgi:type VI secretion system protein ImpM
VRSGFAGKLPARGDFCTRGLPRSFSEPWDAWLAEAMTGSRAILGDAWLPAWLEAPVWRFTLPAGQCGPDAVAGVLLPSVDKAGRHWPLMLGAVGVTCAPDEAWFDALEDAGMEAVLADAPPEQVETMLCGIGDPSPAHSFPSPASGGGSGWGCEDAGGPDSGAPATALPRIAAEGGSRLATWRTLGAPRVAPKTRSLGALPSAADFAAMLADPAPVPGDP